MVVYGNDAMEGEVDDDDDDEGTVETDDAPPEDGDQAMSESEQVSIAPSWKS